MVCSRSNVDEILFPGLEQQLFEGGVVQLRAVFERHLFAVAGEVAVVSGDFGFERREQVAQINNQIAAGYSQIFGDYQVIQGINEALGQEGISAADKARLQAQKQALLAGKAEQIGNIRKLYIQGNNYYSGGAHGFSEDMKAAGTNLSVFRARAMLHSPPEGSITP